MGDGQREREREREGGWERGEARGRREIVIASNRIHVKGSLYRGDGRILLTESQRDGARATVIRASSRARGHNDGFTKLICRINQARGAAECFPAPVLPVYPSINSINMRFDSRTAGNKGTLPFRRSI